MDLQRQLADVDRFIAMYEQFSGTKTEHTEPSRQPAKSVASEPAIIGQARSAARRPGRPRQFAAIAERVLREVGRPMTRSELASEFTKRDVDLPSDDKPRYLGTILWRHRDKFVNSGDGYWLHGVPLGAEANQRFLLSNDQPPPPDLDPQAEQDLAAEDAESE